MHPFPLDWHDALLNGLSLGGLPDVKDRRMRSLNCLLITAMVLCGVAVALNGAGADEYRLEGRKQRAAADPSELSEERGPAPNGKSLTGVTQVRDGLVPPEPSGDSAAANFVTPMSLQEALSAGLESNPDLVALRGGIPASAEAINVARYFPTAINPTFTAEIRPIVRERASQGSAQPETSMIFSLQQPIEFGRRRQLRTSIAEATYSQAYWNVVQNEILTLVQTYRSFQTAAYRREKVRLAEDLATFNDNLYASLKRRFDANQVPAADLALAEIEREAVHQQAETAHIDYVNALAELRNQIGTPESATNVEPAGEFALPPYVQELDEQAQVDSALANRADLQIARARTGEAQGAVCLSQADRIPVPSIGPVFERDEAGTQFYGFAVSTPIPVWNSGKPLVHQREAELQQSLIALHQTETRIAAQVKVAVARWNHSITLARRVEASTARLKPSVATMERLFAAGQADMARLVQARQRLIELENARLDATWQASQAQADLLLAVGAPTLLGSARAASVAAGPTHGQLPTGENSER